MLPGLSVIVRAVWSGGLNAVPWPVFDIGRGSRGWLLASIFIVTSSASVFAHVVASLSAYRAGSYDLGLGFPLGTRVGRGTLEDSGWVSRSSLWNGHGDRAGVDGVRAAGRRLRSVSITTDTSPLVDGGSHVQKSGCTRGPTRRRRRRRWWSDRP